MASPARRWVGVAMVLGLLFVLLTTRSCALNVAVVTDSRQSGIFSVAQELLLRGHRIRVVVPAAEWDDCRARAGPRSCVAAPRVKSDNVSSLSELAEATLAVVTKGSFSPDVFFTSIWLHDIVDNAVARMLGKPTVFLAGYSDALYGSLPQVSLSPLQRIIEGTLQSSLKNVFERHHVIVPFPFGVGFPDEHRCPNVHSVGFLPERLLPRRGLSEAVHRWIDSCQNGIIFVDMKVSEGVELYGRTVAALDQLSLRRSICIAWPSLHTDVPRVPKPTSPLFLAIGRDVDRETILGRNNTKLLVSPSCDLGTLETAAQSETVLMVLRSSSKLSQACSMVNSTSLGIIVDFEREKSRLYDFFNGVWNNTIAAGEMRRIFRYNHLLGGPPKAAQVVETAAYLGRNNSDFLCSSHSSWLRENDLDVTIIGAGILSCALFVVARVIYPLSVSILRGSDGA